MLVLILIKTNLSYPNGRSLVIRMLRHTLLPVSPVLDTLFSGLPILSWGQCTKTGKKRKGRGKEGGREGERKDGRKEDKVRKKAIFPTLFAAKRPCYYSEQ